MVERATALDGHYKAGRYGAEGDGGVTLSLIPDLQMHQIACWPETISEVASMAASGIGSTEVPGPGVVIEQDNQVLLRVEPLKWWLIGSSVPSLTPEQGATLDISHSRTRLHIGGERAAELLNRVLPLDLRNSVFPKGSVASSSLHHVGVTLWHSANGYNLFIPRGFAVSVWEILFDSAKQFGVDVV